MFNNSLCVRTGWMYASIYMLLPSSSSSSESFNRNWIFLLHPHSTETRLKFYELQNCVIKSWVELSRGKRLDWVAVVHVFATHKHSHDCEDFLHIKRDFSTLNWPFWYASNKKCANVNHVLVLIDLLWNNSESWI